MPFPTPSRHSRHLAAERHPRKAAGSVIPVKLIPLDTVKENVGEIDVEIAVVVIVAQRDTHAVTGIPQTAGVGFVDEFRRCRY